MTYNAGGDKWDVKNTYTSQALLNAAYGDGNYSLTALTQTISPISITGDLFPSAPLATNLSGGTISGGILTWNVAQALTITITGAADHMSIDVNGTSYNNGTEAFSVASHTFIIPASSMLAGNNYNVQLNFDNVVGGIPGLQTVATGPLAFVPAQYAGIYNAVTTFTIQAIPEPSTYAEIFGAVALAGVVIARRRRVA